MEQMTNADRKLERGMWRGKAIGTDDWTIGWRTGRCTIRDKDNNHVYRVDPSTLGEWMGRYDWFEGDILESDKGYCVIIWRYEGFELEHKYKRMFEGKEAEMVSYVPLTSRGKNKVGNRWDNPTLLGGA